MSRPTSSASSRPHSGNHGIRSRVAVPAVAAAGLLACLTGSSASAALPAAAPAVTQLDPAVLAGALTTRTTVADDPATASAVEDARQLADTQSREQGMIRAARATAERKAVATRIAKAKKAKAAAKRWVNPLAHPNLTSSFGYRWGRLHAGLDFGTPVGTPLRAMSSGTVVKAGPAQGYGLKIEIRYWNGVVSYYGHLSAITVKVGQKVAPGTLVGASGNTGHSTGPHLHLEIHPGGGDAIDPKPWLRAHKIAF